MDETSQILTASRKRIDKLNAYSQQIKEPSLVSIYIKTEIIHNLFEENENNNLDIYKLELFHLQYTDSLIDLLAKINMQQEISISILNREIEANQNYLEQININDADFEQERKVHSGKVSLFISKLNNYEISKDENININDIKFLTNKYGSTYYRTMQNCENLKPNSSTTFLHYHGINFDANLLEILSNHLYKARFICGYNIDNRMYELFRVFQSEKYFIWDIIADLFYLLPDEIADSLDKSKNNNKKGLLDKELQNRNIELKEKINDIKSSFPIEIIDLLNEYKKTLDNIELLKQHFDFNEETNILKSMLDLNLNNTKKVSREGN